MPDHSPSPGPTALSAPALRLIWWVQTLDNAVMDRIGPRSDSCTGVQPRSECSVARSAASLGVQPRLEVASPARPETPRSLRPTIPLPAWLRPGRRARTGLPRL